MKIFEYDIPGLFIGGFPVNGLHAQQMPDGHAGRIRVYGLRLLVRKKCNDLVLQGD